MSERVFVDIKCEERTFRKCFSLNTDHACRDPYRLKFRTAHAQKCGSPGKRVPIPPLKTQKAH
ncbi:MAG: hypothetical protein J6J31_00915 [Thermoguttaceae bacterium]|nr:hypothetical protein [Thermoguttaceae bacterium]